MQTVHFEHRVGNKETGGVSVFFFSPSLTIRKLFTVRYCDGMEGRCDGRGESSSMPYLFPSISLLFTVYSRKLLTFRGVAEKWNWWKANKKVDWHGPRKWNLFYMFARVYGGPWSASFQQMTSASFVVVDIVVERGKKKKNKEIINVEFHVSFGPRFSHPDPDGLLLLFVLFNGRDLVKRCIRNCRRYNFICVMDSGKLAYHTGWNEFLITNPLNRLTRPNP